MVVTPRMLVLVTVAASVVVFSAVQDRVTAAGARRYVTLQREALAADAAPVAIDQIMGPAVDRSVQQGLIWGGLVLVAGLVMAAFVRRRALDRQSSAAEAVRG